MYADVEVEGANAEGLRGVGQNDSRRCERVPEAEHKQACKCKVLGVCTGRIKRENYKNDAFRNKNKYRVRTDA